MLALSGCLDEGGGGGGGGESAADPARGLGMLRDSGFIHEQRGS